MTKEQLEILLKQVEVLSDEEICLLIEEKAKSLKESMVDLSRGDELKFIMRERKKELYFKSKENSKGESVFSFVNLQALEQIETEFWFKNELST